MRTASRVVCLILAIPVLVWIGYALAAGDHTAAVLLMIPLALFVKAAVRP